MRQRLLFTLISLACSVAFATTVYKWVDDNGVIHYSDQPHPNAQKLQVQGVQTYSSNAASVRAPAESESGSTPPNPYKGCAIAQPLDQQNLPNAQSVFIRVAADPLPRGGDRIYILMDGQGLNGGQPTGLGFNVTPIERGSHTLSAQIRSPDGTILCQTPTVTFYVQQPNLFSPGMSSQPGVSPRPR
jgi:Domain of unknown function (DUF4124)